MKLWILVTVCTGLQLALAHVVIPKSKPNCNPCPGKCGTSTEPDLNGTLLDSLFSFVSSVYPFSDPYGPELFDPTTGVSISEPLPGSSGQARPHTLHIPEDKTPCPYTDVELQVLLDAALNRYGRKRAINEIKRRRRNRKVLKRRRNRLGKFVRADASMGNFVMNIPSLGTVEVELFQNNEHESSFRVRKNSKWNRLARYQSFGPVIKGSGIGRSPKGKLRNLQNRNRLRIARRKNIGLYRKQKQNYKKRNQQLRKMRNRKRKAQGWGRQRVGFLDCSGGSGAIDSSPLRNGKGKKQTSDCNPRIGNQPAGPRGDVSGHLHIPGLAIGNSLPHTHGNPLPHSHGDVFLHEHDNPHLPIARGNPNVPHPHGNPHLQHDHGNPHFQHDDGNSHLPRARRDSRSFHEDDD